MTALLSIVWNPEAVMNPLVVTALVAAGLVSCLFLFVTLKGEMRGLHRRGQEQKQQIENLETALAECKLAAQTLETELRAVEQQTGMLVAPAPARSGLNLSKRTQVLRMHRSGQDSASIASALSVARSEVDLLIKVHLIALENL